MAETLAAMLYRLRTEPMATLWPPCDARVAVDCTGLAAVIVPDHSGGYWRSCRPCDAITSAVGYQPPAAL